MTHPKRDITGGQFAWLTVLEYAGTNVKGGLWKCRCACGAETLVNYSDLRAGNRKSCGCKARWPQHLVGQTFHHLTVIAQAESTERSRMWICLCTCGKETVVRTQNLKSGNTKSCGCQQYSRYHHTAQGGL